MKDYFLVTVTCNTFGSQISLQFFVSDRIPSRLHVSVETKKLLVAFNWGSDLAPVLPKTLSWLFSFLASNVFA